MEGRVSYWRAVGKPEWAEALEQSLAKAERCQTINDVVLDLRQRLEDAERLKKEDRIMSLPKRNDKEYLQSEPSQDGHRISGQKEHTDELAVLFAQHGITCQHDGEGVLRFAPDVDRVRVAELLESYKQAKGS